MRARSAAVVLLAVALGGAWANGGGGGFSRLRGWLRARPSPHRFPVRGIDVSHHQGLIDWPRVARSGVSFAFIKASEGADFRDTRFERNFDQARRAGVAAGAYHFFTFCSSGRDQARHFVDVLGTRRPTLPPAVDVEFSGNCRAWQSEEAVSRELVEFVAGVERELGRPALLYTTSEAFRRVIPESLRSHAFWLRDLFGEPEAGGVRLSFWQYADSGRVDGVRGPVDLNAFHGSRRSWLRRLAGPGPVESWHPPPRCARVTHAALPSGDVGPCR